MIFTKKFILLVPLSEPYETDNGSKTYFDGLAYLGNLKFYLGFIHTTDAIKPYQLNKKEFKSKGASLRRLLHYCANGKQKN